MTSGREVGARLSPGAHLLTRDDRFHDALNAVNAAVMLGVGAEMALRWDAITNARMPEPIPVFPAPQAMQKAIGDSAPLSEVHTTSVRGSSGDSARRLTGPWSE